MPISKRLVVAMPVIHRWSIRQPCLSAVVNCKQAITNLAG